MVTKIHNHANKKNEEALYYAKEKLYTNNQRTFGDQSSLITPKMWGQSSLYYRLKYISFSRTKYKTYHLPTEHLYNSNILPNS